MALISGSKTKIKSQFETRNTIVIILIIVKPDKSLKQHKLTNKCHI